MVITLRKRVPGPSYDVIPMLKKQMGSKRDLKPLDRFKKTKIFIKAKLAGATTTEARNLSGLPATLSLKQILDSDIAQGILEEICKQEEFRDEGLVKRFKEMWHKKKVVHVNGLVIGEEDDTDMWKYSMDKILNLRGYLKSGRDSGEKEPSVLATEGITFNVLHIPNEKIEEKK